MCKLGPSSCFLDTSQVIALDFNFESTNIEQGKLKNNTKRQIRLNFLVMVYDVQI